MYWELCGVIIRWGIFDLGEAYGSIKYELTLAINFVVVIIRVVDFLVVVVIFNLHVLNLVVLLHLWVPFYFLSEGVHSPGYLRRYWRGGTVHHECCFVLCCFHYCCFDGSLFHDRGRGHGYFHLCCHFVAV